MKNPVGSLYCVATAHLDTAWIWDVRMTINHFIPATVRDNIARIERCPNYVFSFEGSFHYALVKEYWPEEWRLLKEYVRRGRCRQFRERVRREHPGAGIAGQANPLRQRLLPP